MKMSFAICFPVLFLFGACTASGPTYNLDSITTGSGSRAFRAQCQGVLESTESCIEQANKMCGESNYDFISRSGGFGDGPEKATEIVFSCKGDQDKRFGKMQEGASGSFIN